MKAPDPAILKCKGCRHCPIRGCARKRGLASCGLCLEWKTCQRLASLLADCPEARPILERIQAAAHKS